MSNKTLIFLLISLIMLSNTALAAKWVYLQPEGTRYGAGTEYFDVDSVVKEGSKLMYWVMWVRELDSPPGHPKTIVWKKEVLLDKPMQWRCLETYQYDVAGNPAVINNFSYQKPLDFFPVEQGSQEEILINRVLQYAGEGKASDAIKPDHFIPPSPKWYGYVEYADCNLYWDIHSIFAWPGDNPNSVEIMVKWIWNERGREERKAILNAQNPCSGDYDNISYTMVNYQFSNSEKRMKMLAIIDYNAKNRSVAFSTGSKWQDIVPGSKDDMARQIALNWLNDSEGEK